MSQNECRALDWRTIGYEDGVQGRSGDHIANYRQACGKYGVRTDLDLYQQGRMQGLREFCQPVNGYNFGVRGGAYYGVCPVELERPFLSAFDAGHQLYVLTARVSNADAALSSKRIELANIEHGILGNSMQAVLSDSPPDDRAHAVLDVAQLSQRAAQLKIEIGQLNADRARYQQELDAYLASHQPVT
ncbi:MAG: DUF2799 domain-containing protein [Proteobacteria bacterium]|nr:DUF2799 domain-containing protein [Pseudomonadota bacterium]